MVFCSGVCSGVATEDAGLSGAVCAPLVGANRPSARIAVTPSDVFTEDLFLLWNELLCDGKWPPKPKGPRRDLQSRRGLFALVFLAVHMQRNILHQLEIEAVTICNFLRALQVLNIQL